VGREFGFGGEHDIRSALVSVEEVEGVGIFVARSETFFFEEVVDSPGIRAWLWRC